MATELILNHGIINFLFHNFTKFQIETFQNIKDQIDLNFKNQNNLVVNTTWASIYSIKDVIIEQMTKTYYDNIFLISVVDEILPEYFIFLNDIAKNTNVYQIGDIDDTVNSKKIKIQFSSILTNQFFNFVDNKNLLLNFENLKLFLCYQNKPHMHRQIFTLKSIEHNIINDGILTLHGKKTDFRFDELTCLDIEENDTVNFYVNREDPYSFGNLTVWNRCFLNIVSETCFNGKYFFSEKTYKPIIGLRPFVILGNYEIIKYLKNNGFYTFEEYWNEKFHNWLSVEECSEKIISVIKFLKTKNISELQAMYYDMLPKLEYNKNLFFEHAKKENYKLSNLFKGYV